PMNSFDVVVIGGGHAGIEAAHASARLGCATALVTMDLKAIGRMSCNPAIGGVAKGQLVRDIDALGGLMGLVADQAGIQFRMLNLSKGPAVWGPRAQMDMDDYAARMQGILSVTPNLSLIAGELLTFDRLPDGELRLHLGVGFAVRTRAVVITSGTFLGAVMHTGMDRAEGGRIGEPAAVELAAALKDQGLKTRRLKTGTPARLAADSLDYGEVEVQHGDAEPYPFSFRTEGPLKNRAVCWITRTSKETHDILRAGFDRSPLFTGVIQGLGPRYCPSIEDKVSRFADRDSHQLFLEPEGLDSGRIYVNGFSSSLPREVQEEALRTLPGLRRCRILRHGYAVEYDSVDATQLHPTFECRDLPGVYFAGQVNGTSGYEEAAAQGLVAGINAALKIRGREPFLLARAESYIGVLADDLVSLHIDEPYRMFTSRAEYRLHLRQDNAEDRLLEKGHALGLVEASVLRKYEKRRARLDALRGRLAETKVTAGSLNPFLAAQGGSPVSESVYALPLMRRPEVPLPGLLAHLGISTAGWTRAELTAFEASERYQAFQDRQQREIDRSLRLIDLRIPEAFDYEEAKGLSLEARQKLRAVRPLTVGHAQRIAGVTPADISGLIYHLNRKAA
ncbi:MAG: glucose inhibited division protein, partial [Fibrobacteria bacterium]|nr:glucose inhibited division protein [Fibrobacteria bacterium]